MENKLVLEGTVKAFSGIGPSVDRFAPIESHNFEFNFVAPTIPHYNFTLPMNVPFKLQKDLVEIAKNKEPIRVIGYLSESSEYMLTKRNEEQLVRFARIEMQSYEKVA